MTEFTLQFVFGVAGAETAFEYGRTMYFAIGVFLWISAFFFTVALFSEIRGWLRKRGG